MANIGRSNAIARMQGSVFSATPRGSRMGQMGHLGRVPVVNGTAFRRVVLGQDQEPAPDDLPPGDSGQNGRARAWGQLKKLEAEEFMVALQDIEARMGELKLPPGIVTQIADRLQVFLNTSAPDATFEMTEEEMNGLDAVIFAVETREAEQKAPGLLVPIVGAAIVATALIFIA